MEILLRGQIFKNFIKNSPEYLVSMMFLIFSQAILANNTTLYVSGVLGLDRDSQLVPGGVEAQTRQALCNLQHVLEAGGATFESVIKTTVLLGDIQDFKSVNQIYGECKQE